MPGRARESNRRPKKLLLDTHTALWWWAGDSGVSEVATKALAPGLIGGL